MNAASVPDDLVWAVPELREFIAASTPRSTRRAGSGRGAAQFVEHPLPDAAGRLPDAAGRPPDAVKPDIHCVRTHWIRGFMTLQLARRARTVVLMVPA